jgi:hypothetical protein
MEWWAGTYVRAIDDFLYDNIGFGKLFEHLWVIWRRMIPHVFTSKQIRGGLARAFSMHILLHPS